jgi:hypothetical protein
MGTIETLLDMQRWPLAPGGNLNELATPTIGPSGTAASGARSAGISASAYWCLRFLLSRSTRWMMA